MTDIQRAEQALRNAHEAGDVESAKKIAAFIRSTSSSEPNLSQKLSGRGSDIEKSAERYSAGEVGLPRTALHMGGSVAGGVGDVIGEGLEKAYDVVEPVASPYMDYVKFAADVVTPEPLQKAGKNLMGYVGEKVEDYQNWAQENPERAKDFESVYNIVTAVPALRTTAKVGAAAAKEGGQILRKGADKASEASVKFAERGKDAPVLPEISSDIAERGVQGAQAFPELRETIKLQADFARKKKDQAFKTAEELGDLAFVKSDDLNNLRNRIGQLTSIDSSAQDVYRNALSEVDRFATSPQASVNAIEGFRRDLTNISKSGGTAGYAAGQVKRQIDDFLDSADIVGDQKAVSAWKDAIKQNREYATKFEEPREIARAIAGGSNEEIERAFIGGASPSMAKGASRVYDDVIKALPKKEGARAGFLMRQSVLNNMVKRSVRSAGEGDLADPRFMAREIRNLRNDNKSLWEKFTPGEQFTLMKLEKDLQKASSSGWVNKAGEALLKIASVGSGKVGLYLPRTIQFKRTMDVDDLINLTKIKPSKLPENK